MAQQAEENRRRFDAAAAGWDAKPERVALARALADAVRAAVPLRPATRLLDFGAGTGLVALALAAEVAEVTALDASGEMLRALAEKARAGGIRNLHTLHGDIAEAPLPAGRFDVVVSSMVLHHLPDVPRVLARLRPALRPGGWIALADLDAEDGSFHADKTGVYHSGFDRAGLCRWLAGAGFTDATVRDAHRLAKAGADGVTRDYPIFLATARA